MSNRKVTELVALTTPVNADLLHIIDDVAGVPTNKKITISDITPYENVRYQGAVGDGVTDDTVAIQAALDVGGKVVIPGSSGAYIHNTKLTMTISNTTLIFDQGAILKAGATMTSQIEMGDGVNRKEDIQLINPRLDGDSKASYGIADLGTRISGIFDGYFESMIEYCILQQPSTSDFSEFMNIERCQGFDGKGFYKHLATASSFASDTWLVDNIHFRPTRWFAVLDTCSRFKLRDNMVGNATTTYLGGVDIRCNDTLTANTITAQHDIDGIYVESTAVLAPAVFTGAHDGAANQAVMTDSGEAFTVNEHVGRTIINITDGSSTIVTANTATTVTGILSGGTDNDWDNGDTYEILGIIAVQVSNNSSAKTIGGCTFEQVFTQPANEVAVCNLRSPTTASTLRDINIGGIDTKAAFANAITIGNGVVKTRVEHAGFQGSTDGKITDRGTDTVINNLTERSYGVGGTPTVGDPGTLILNTADNVFWTMDNAGNFLKLASQASETVAATNVILAIESGKTFYLNLVGGFTSTLPAPAVGLNFKFIVKTAPTTAYIITTNAGADILFGTFLDIVGELVYFSAQDTLNFVAMTSLVGDRLEVESDGTNWYCKAFSGADGGITVSVT